MKPEAELGLIFRFSITVQCSSQVLTGRFIIKAYTVVTTSCKSLSCMSHRRQFSRFEGSYQSINDIVFIVSVYKPDGMKCTVTCTSSALFHQARSFSNKMNTISSIDRRNTKSLIDTTNAKLIFRRLGTMFHNKVVT